MNQYANNPFRILGIKSTATTKEAKRSADRLLQWIELGNVPEVGSDFPFLPNLSLDRETIKAALKEIEDPVRRIRHEVFWPSSDFVDYDKCVQALKEQRSQAFLNICQAYQENTDALMTKMLALHYTVIFYHSANIERTRGIFINGSSPEEICSWDQALSIWKDLFDRTAFWEYLRTRISQYQDPRIKSQDIESLRSALPLELLKINADLGLLALSRTRAMRADYIQQEASAEQQRNKAEFNQLGKSIYYSHFPADAKDRAAEVLASALLVRFTKVQQGIQQKLSDEQIRRQCGLEQALATESDSEIEVAKLQAGKYLDQVESEIRNSVLQIAEQVRDAALDFTDSGIAVLEGTVRLLRSLGLGFNNQAGNSSAALRVCSFAQAYVEKTDLKELLETDEATLRFLAYRDEAVELLRNNNIRASLSKLQECLQFARTEEDQQQIHQWIENAQRMLAFEDVKQIDSAPSLGTIFYGIGTKLYGNRDYDPGTKSYIATLFFTILWIPILPLAAYRVISVDENTWRFLGKVPLSKGSLKLLLIAPAIVLLLIIFGVFNESSSTRSTSSQSSTESSTGSESKSESESESGSVLRAWLDQEKTRLLSEQSAIKSLGTQLDSDKRSLDLAESLAGSESDQQIYQIRINTFNSQVEAYNERLRKYREDLANFNRQVDLYNSQR